jgi:transcription elongation factor Elf1
MGFYEKYGKAWALKNRDKINANRRQKRQKVRKWLDEYRATLTCSRCPENHPSCLDFHHPNDDKELNIGKSTTRDCTIEKIKAEIKKCIVLCSNCHKKLHYEAKIKNSVTSASAR